MKRTFTRDELNELGVAFNGKAVVHDEQIDTSRWATIHEAVFRADPDGPLWSITYQLPATEQQECDRWFDEDPVEAIQVEPYEVTVTKYRPVADPPLDVAAGVDPYAIPANRIGENPERTTT